MNQPDPRDRLRRLVPYLGAAIFFQAGFFIYVLFAKEKPRLWPMLAGDLVLTVVVLAVLWRALGRRR